RKDHAIQRAVLNGAIDVQGLVERALFQVWEDENAPVCGIDTVLVAHRELFVSVMVVVQGQSNLLHVVDALGAGSGLAHLLDGRNEKGDEDSDDGDDNEQFDQRKAANSETEQTTSHKNVPPRDSER